MHSFMFGLDICRPVTAGAVTIWSVRRKTEYLAPFGWSLPARADLAGGSEQTDAGQATSKEPCSPQDQGDGFDSKA